MKSVYLSVGESLKHQSFVASWVVNDGGVGSEDLIVAWIGMIKCWREEE